MEEVPDKLAAFDKDCIRCPRIAGHLSQIRKEYPHYYAGPVPAFGDEKPLLLVVGLGPGLHGANATGRPFTGDHAGILLYQMLYDFGYSNRAISLSRNDGLVLKNCRISNAVKCLPPANKPLPSEIHNCNSYLRAELASMTGRLIILALGRIAHEAVVKALGLKPRNFLFGHHALHKLSDNRYLLDSYHCSRYNTQTRRLTEPMFRQVFATASELLNAKV